LLPSSASRRRVLVVSTARASRALPRAALSRIALVIFQFTVVGTTIFLTRQHIRILKDEQRQRNLLRFIDKPQLRTVSSAHEALQAENGNEEDSILPIGVLSYKDTSFFRKLQQEIDDADPVDRCARYGWTYNGNTYRRIFYGALLASEPWELYEIVAAESYGIYDAMVLVEGNRTQNLTPRPFQRLNDGPALAQLFGIADTDRLQVRSYVQEEKQRAMSLDREHKQRGEIIQGWKEMGMQVGDIGLLADTDESLTRDFLRAIQSCDGIEPFDYESHHCKHTSVKLSAATRVFETSPECIFKSWSAGDFRATFGGGNRARVQESHLDNYDQFTGYHFHNFFAEFNSTRHKYRTYGHPDKLAYEKPIEELSRDLKLMHRCVKGLADDPEQVKKRIPGGFKAIKPFLPIYFQDEEYRRRRHDFVKEMIEEDERLIIKSVGSSVPSDIQELAESGGGRREARYNNII